MTTLKLTKQLQLFPGSHPSGINNEGELAYVSAEYFSTAFNSGVLKPNSKEMWDTLLSFQKGWKACKDFYSIND